ncbi:MAG: energy-coupled thiamine transporter ThiT [Clostridia bacterium]|nr:energy-coupled thiamine transporter ThiT [Clostridia bacterium]
MTQKQFLKRESRLHILTEAGLMVAMATVLSMIKVYEAPFGGSVTLLSMAPIIILSMRRGVKVGLAGGFVHSVIQLVLGLANVGWVPDLGGKVLCILFDYILPFTALGLGGLFRSVRFTKSAKGNLVIAAVLGTILVTVFRFVCHILSGVVIWYALDLEWYADDPTHIVNRYSKWIFSIVYNSAFMLPEIIETVIGVPILTTALSAVKTGEKNKSI